MHATRISIQAFFSMALILLLALGLEACNVAQNEPQTLRLATTTSTEDSGLLDAILPEFESQQNARLEVIAVGTGQALALGEAGDADVLLVHAPAREAAFVADGHGTQRYDVMYNDFVIVGPRADPAGIRALAQAADALAAIASAQAPWASRGDESGTYVKELSLWQAARVKPAAGAEWHNSLGQGMGATLQFANEVGAYTLTDRGTFLSQADHLPNLVILLGGESIDENPDPALYNPYGVIPVNPKKSEAINHALALDFVAWLTSVETQQRIADFGAEEYGQPLFHPNSEAWNSSQP